MKNFRKHTVATLIPLATLLLLSGCLDLMDEPVSESGPTGTISPDSPVTVTNNSLTISGTPGNAVKISETYSFTPTVANPDGDSLTFYIGNIPPWASFSATTGKFSGTPGFADVGTYSNIQIVVNSGSKIARLPKFSVSVTQTGLGSATLSWKPPTQNTDGSSLTDLAAYKIYYGVSKGNYPNQVQIDNPGITMYVVDNLTPNTYYFVSTSINSGGIESGFSNVATKLVN
jgi:putative Ig domain-containing protein